MNVSGPDGNGPTNSTAFFSKRKGGNNPDEDGTMDSISAFAKGEANRGKDLMVFDWDKAAQLISEMKPSVASAGLAGDWEYTGGEIFRDGKPLSQDETYVYLASTWATPEINIDGEVLDCFKMQSETPGWDSDTFWPETSLAIIAASPAS